VRLSPASPAAQQDVHGINQRPRARVLGHGRQGMVTRSDVRDVLQRMTGVWTRLKSNDELRQEIGHAIMRHAERLERDDLRNGVDAVMLNTRAQQRDGGPAVPPGPHEVVGCILAARERRVRDQGPLRTWDRQRGVTFQQWWATIPAGERPQHETLRRMMEGMSIMPEVAGA